MAWEHAPISFAQRAPKGFLHQDRSKTSQGWRALLERARHKERLRIARELHDTLLQEILSASMQLCVVDERLPGDSPAKPILRRALDLIGKAVDEGRSVLQGLRFPLADGSLEKALGDIRDDFAPGDATRLRIVIVGETRPLAPAVQAEIYWIAREALLNALRHSTGSRVEAEIEYLPRKLRVFVRDNGIGIDLVAMRTRRNSHWGLTGMQERATSIGAKVRVWSKEGEGTEVEISLPIHRLGKTV